MHRIDAIIPTTGRPELVRAVRSVLDQDLNAMPVVVLDRPEVLEDVRNQLSPYPHVLVSTRGGVGGSGARNFGIEKSSAYYVGFLDDDDEWLPQKTSTQLAALQDDSIDVSTTGAFLIGRDTRRVPERAYVSGESMSNYLLYRSTLKLRVNFMQTSSIVMRREFAVNNRWPEVGRHQDWGYLIDLSRRNARIAMIDAPLTRVYQGSDRSISRSSDWKTSMSWLESQPSDISRRARADFTASIALRSALRAGEWRAAVGLLGKSVRAGAHPAALAVGLSGVSSQVRRPAKRERPKEPSKRYESGQAHA